MKHEIMTYDEAKGTKYEDAVCEWGLSVCKHCRAAEIDLDHHDTCEGYRDAVQKELEWLANNCQQMTVRDAS